MGEQSQTYQMYKCRSTKQCCQHSVRKVATSCSESPDMMSLAYLPHSNLHIMDVVCGERVNVSGFQPWEVEAIYINRPNLTCILVILKDYKLIPLCSSDAAALYQTGTVFYAALDLRAGKTFPSPIIRLLVERVSLRARLIKEKRPTSGDNMRNDFARSKWCSTSKFGSLTCGAAGRAADER